MAQRSVVRKVDGRELTVPEALEQWRQAERSSADCDQGTATESDAERVARDAHLAYQEAVAREERRMDLRED